MKALVKEFRFIENSQAQRGSGMHLSADDYVAGLNLLYAHRLPESGCKLPKKQGSLRKIIGSRFKRQYRKEEFQEFLIQAPCNTNRPSLWLPMTLHSKERHRVAESPCRALYRACKT